MSDASTFCNLPPTDTANPIRHFAQEAIVKQWLSSLFEESPSTASTHRMVFFLAFVLGAALCLSWLLAAAIKAEMTALLPH
jgi:hypothetical protein